MSADPPQKDTLTDEMKQLIQNEKEHQRQTRLANLALARKALANKVKRDQQAKNPQDIQSSPNPIQNEQPEERPTKRVREDYIIDELNDEDVKEIIKNHGGPSKRTKRTVETNSNFRSQFLESLARTAISLGITFGFTCIYKFCLGTGVSDRVRRNPPISNGNPMYFANMRGELSDELSPQLEGNDHLYFGQSIFK